MKERTRWAPWMVAALSLLLATQALAQIPRGDLVGRVTDESGTGLPGVLVTASSDALQGEKTTYTGANGDYKIPFLPAGVYDVTFQLDGFTEVSSRDKLSAAQQSRRDVKMRSSEVIEETIVVTSEYETISQTETGSATFTQDEVEKLAVERTFNEAALLAPGVTATGPGSTEENPVISISGAMSFENLFMINGVVINENVRGQGLPLFIEDAIEETTTSVSGISAEYGRFTGGVVNAITKSGGNQFEGSLRVSLTNDDWISEGNELSPERLDDVNDTLEGTLGGYFLKDHLWFFGAGRDRSLAESGTTRAVTNISFPRTDEETRIEAKLTIAANQRHNLVGSYFDIDRTRTNGGFATFIDLNSLSDRTDPQEIVSANYNGVLTPNFFLEAQVSERDFIIGQGSGGVPDLIQGTLFRSRTSPYRWHAPTFCGECEDEIRNNENFLVKGSYFLTTEKAGTHDIVFGFDTFDDVRFAINHQTGSDFTVFATDTLHNEATNELFPVIDTNSWILWFAIINQDVATPTGFTTNSFYVNDSWQISDKLSINLGARFDENDGTNSEGINVADDSKVSPRLGLTYDVKGNGDLQINATLGTYVAAVANTRADSTSGGGAVSFFLFDTDTLNINNDPGCVAAGTCVSNSDALRAIFDWYISQGGVTDDPFNLDPNSPIVTEQLLDFNLPGATAQILQGINSPAVDELTLGITKRLGNKGSFRGDLVLREWDDFYSNRTTPNSPIFTANTGSQHVTEVGNFGDDVLTREYMGIHTQFRYRITDRLQVSANYAWSELEGNINGETSNSGPVPSSPNSFREFQDPAWAFPEGPLGADQEHKLRAWAIYDLIDNQHHSLSVSLLQNFFSGSPYSLAIGVDTRPFVDAAALGYFPSEIPDTFTYFVSDRGQFTTDDITRTDLSLNYSFHWNAFGRRLNVFVQPEVLNIFDEDAVVGLNTTLNDATDGASCPNSPTGACLAFNPFTETPVEGIHYVRGGAFGTQQNEDDFQRPRLFRVSVGFRF